MLKHETIEKNIALLGLFTVVAISFGGIAEIVPLLSDSEVTKASPGVEPYPALQLAGYNIYVREGCYNCHSQMIRPFRWETERYGAYSVAGESVYDRPFQWGSKRTGPDLARVGGRYSDDWHELHLLDPRAVVPESNMPAFPWLAEQMVDPELTEKSMRVLKETLGHPYTNEQIENAQADVKGKTQLQAVIAYLQGKGLTRTLKR